MDETPIQDLILERNADQLIEINPSKLSGFDVELLARYAEQLGEDTPNTLQGVLNAICDAYLAHANGDPYPAYIRFAAHEFSGRDLGRAIVHLDVIAKTKGLSQSAGSLVDALLTAGLIHAAGRLAYRG